MKNATKWNLSPPKPIKGKRGLKTIGASSHKTEISNNYDEKNDSMILLSVIYRFHLGSSFLSLTWGATIFLLACPYVWYWLLTRLWDYISSQNSQYYFHWVLYSEYELVLVNQPSIDKRLSEPSAWLIYLLNQHIHTCLHLLQFHKSSWRASIFYISWMVLSLHL